MRTACRRARPIAAGMLLLLLVLVLAGCELQGITVATPDDVVIAEVVLRAGASMQTAYLHRTATGGSARVFDAHVEVTEHGTSQSYVFEAAADSLCLKDQPVVPVPSTGTCYLARRAGGSSLVRPGGTYSLRIRLPDGRELTGTTRVPGEFELVTPADRVCGLAPNHIIELTWRAAAGASVYIISTRLSGLRSALRAAGTPIEGDDPVDLFGLSITAADTTLSFPDELGLFNRFDSNLHPIMLAIRTGLPANVRVDGVVAAADRNYVNWVRGGNFNPSGLVRISSIQGDGFGVFGSLSLQDFQLWTEAPHRPPPCR